MFCTGNEIGKGIDFVEELVSEGYEEDQVIAFLEGIFSEEPEQEIVTEETTEDEEKIEETTADKYARAITNLHKTQTTGLNASLVTDQKKKEEN